MLLLLCVGPERGAQMNGHCRKFGRERRLSSESERSPSQGTDTYRDEEENVGRRTMKRKTARAAVNKMKLLEASEEDYGSASEDEDKHRRKSSRHATRVSKRTAVSQSSSESEEQSSAQSEHTVSLDWFGSTFIVHGSTVPEPQKGEFVEKTFNTVG